MSPTNVTTTLEIPEPNQFGRASGGDRPQDQGSESALQFEQVVLFLWLHRIGNECDSIEQLLRRASEVICCQSDCLGLWATQLDADRSFNQIYSVLTEPGVVEWDSFQGMGRRMIKLAASSSQIQSSPILDSPEHQLIVVPIIDGTRVETMIAGCFHRDQSMGDHNEWLMGILGQSMSNWLGIKRLQRSEIRSRSLNDVVALIQELDRSSSLAAASLILVNQIKKMTQAQQVAFATCARNQLPKLQAVSDVEAADQSLDATRAITQACGSAIQAKRILVYPDRRQVHDPADLVPLERYCKTNGFDACISVPITKSGQQVVGALLLAVPPKHISEEGHIQYLGQLASLVSGHLDIVLKANRSLTEHVAGLMREFLKGQLARLVMALMAISIAILLIPFPYRVLCECEIQPVLRRFIAAPHNGVLERNMVKNGDEVSAEQVVAQLDGRQLRIELAGLEAQHKATAKRRSAAMANSQIAEGQIALNEMKKLESQITLILDKLRDLEIRSPIAGIVVAGDLQKVEGAPVEMGQTLFEVGPLDQMLAEIAIPEAEIPYVQAGMKITIKLNAYPFRTWSGTIARIHPKAEIREQKSVFVAEVQLENDDRSLKPGMNGQAKVTSNYYPLGWNLFHQPWEKIRYWTVW